MCAQCAMGAMTAGAAATGMRAWLVARSPSWLTARRRRAVTGVLLGAGVLAAGLVTG